MLRFSPHYKQVIWGGTRLQGLFDDPNALPKTGEIWVLGEVAGFDPTALGDEEGPTLSQRWLSGELGGSASGQFPLLLKWLDTSAPLSVQVHPDAALGEELGGHSKHEAWYFLDPDPTCEHPDAGTVWAGWANPPSQDALLEEAREGSLPHRMKTWKPKAGDIIDLAPRTFHALGPGLTLLEVQQPSDTTYRVYDWGRMGLDGKPRDLHLNESVRCLRSDRDDTLAMRRAPLSTPYFRLDELTEGDTWDAPRDALRILVALEESEAQTEAGSQPLKRGECWVMEASDGDFRSVGPGAVLGVHVPLP